MDFVPLSLKDLQDGQKNSEFTKEEHDYGKMTAKVQKYGLSIILLSYLIL